MSNFFNASIGRKLLMSISGLFLILFLFVHLTLNLLLTFDDTGELFNQAAHFMATNPMIRIMEPMLALGFMVHIIWSAWITLVNQRARPQKYESGDNLLNWWAPSKNMFILGAMVMVFLILHLFDFYIKMKVTGHELLTTITYNGIEMENAYNLVSAHFINFPAYCIFYIVSGILVGLHITHGFWSAFQTIGFSNQVWLKRLRCLALFVGTVLALGYAYIPLYFMIKF